jgi:putative DNA primase/helicase
LPIAALYSERLSEETARILASRGLDKKAKRERIAEARARLVAEAVACLPKCDTVLIAPDGETYAYVSAPEAQAYCKQKTQYTARTYTYTPPAPAADHLRPLSSQDLKRIEDKIRTTIEDELDRIRERNSFDEARLFSKRIDAFVPKVTASWVKVAGASKQAEKEEKRINQHVIEIVGLAPSDQVVSSPEIETGTPQNFWGVSSDKSLDSSEIENPVFETAPDAPAADFVQKRAELEETAPAAASPDPDPATAPESAALKPAVNFDSSLEAATFYARDGFPVLPVCQWVADAGRCTGEKHGPDCKGRKPLVKGNGSEGYSGATRDLAKIRDWFARLFPQAGVAIRLDGHIAIDCDVKDNAGGLESYQILADTFALPDTMSAVTHSGGRHFIFRLPEGLPANWLKSWIRVGDKSGLPGIDLKVDTNGLLFVEPTCGPKGVYRWIDPCQEPATLPRACADFLHETRYKQTPEEKEKAKVKAGKRVASPSLRTFERDQSKFFRDVPEGDRHKRLLDVGVAIRCNSTPPASAAEIADGMRWHAFRFSTPLNDEKALRWIERTAKSIEKKYGG